MRHLRGIRFRLLAAVNTSLVILLLVFLVTDYRREIAARVAEKHIALEEEAKTLLPGIVRLRPEGRAAIQEYVDAVCGKMQDAASPGHHIAVGLDGTVLQAMAHRRESPEMLAAMHTADQSPVHQAHIGVENLVVGSDHDEDVSVYVSEYLSDIARSAQGQVFWRLARIGLLTAVATGVVNVVFLRMAAKPLEKLADTVQRIAQGQLGAKVGPFKAAELEYLAGEINSMSSSLAEIDMQRRREIAKARRIQEHLLPKGIEIPGMTLSHLYQPADEVAGDYFDIVPLPDQTWLLCIADVSGHGVPAAMTAGMLKILLLHATEYHVIPDQILHFINDRFSAVCLEGDFASMLLARWIPQTKTLEYASAGHGLAWCRLSGSGAIRELSSTGVPLGVLPNARWELKTLPVACGERLLVVTDGVTETFDPEGEQFGWNRLFGILADCEAAPMAEIVHAIDEAVNAHRGGAASTDDCTVVAVEFAA